jgi:hypothetical protein
MYNIIYSNIFFVFSQLLLYVYIKSHISLRGEGTRNCVVGFIASRKVADWTHDVIGFFYWQFFLPHYNPEVDSAGNRNEYQVGKGGLCVGLTIILS